MGKPVKKPTYRVRTWDYRVGEFTKQKGVREKNAGLAGLRRALRLLRNMGYETRREDACSVLVEVVGG